MRILLAIVFGIVMVSPLSGDHIHLAHPTTSHGSGSAGSGWYRISLTEGPTSPTVAAGPEVWVVLVDHNETNNNCNTSTPEIETKRSVSHTCKVGGKVTVGGSVEAAAGALFAKCKATASASVEVNGEFSDTTVEEVVIKSSTSVDPCHKVNYTFKKLKKTANGSISTWDHKIVCRKGSRRYTSYCNKVTLTGSAVGWGKTDGVWTALGKQLPCHCDEEEPEDPEEPPKAGDGG